MLTLFREGNPIICSMVETKLRAFCLSSAFLRFWAMVEQILFLLCRRSVTALPTTLVSSYVHRRMLSYWWLTLHQICNWMLLSRNLNRSMHRYGVPNKARKSAWCFFISSEIFKENFSVSEAPHNSTQSCFHILLEHHQQRKLRRLCEYLSVPIQPSLSRLSFAASFCVLRQFLLSSTAATRSQCFFFA